MSPWEAVARRAGLDGVRLHDLRHTYASFGAGGGLGLPIIGKLLGHTQALTTPSVRVDLSNTGTCGSMPCSWTSQFSISAEP
jgi:integrase